MKERPMTRPALLWSCCGAVCLSLMAGCVSDQASATRPAWWVSHASEDESKHFARQADKKPTAKLQLAYGKMQEELGNHVDARKSYQSVLGEDPRSVDATLGLARIDQLAGRSADAEQGFQKALRLRPDSPVTHDAMGQYLAAQKRFPEAIHHLNTAMVKAPDEASYRYHLGVAMVRSGDIAGGLPHLERTVGAAEAQYNVGYILYEKGDMAGAEKHFLAASMKEPGLEVAQQMLDEIRHVQGRENVFPTAATDRPRLERTLPVPSGADPSLAKHRADPPQRATFASESAPSSAASEPEAWNGGASSSNVTMASGLQSQPSEPPAWPGRAASSQAMPAENVPFGHTNPGAPSVAPQGFGASTEPKPTPRNGAVEFSLGVLSIRRPDRRTLGQSQQVHFV